jgi:geranylgeranyl diphosphate synthase type II
MTESRVVTESLETMMMERAALVVRFLDFHFDEEAQSKTLPSTQSSARGSLQTSTPNSTDSMKTGRPQGLSELWSSIRYSLLQEGGKRFRPVLAMLCAEALGQPKEIVLPYAAALECVHTYSLIHDDLPAMDNDDMRRGQPTNHKKFNEATAILAGDALLTEAFALLAENYGANGAVGMKAVAALAHAAGIAGMVGGQAIDMAAKSKSPSLEELQLLHQLKTGALIRAAASGVAKICGATVRQTSELELFAENLGLAFQVADDILDYDPEKIEVGSYPAAMGIERTKQFLDELTESCFDSLDGWPQSADPLREMAKYNQTRTV